MDVEKFIDDFDSLWFFSNIFSSSSSPSSTCSNATANMTQNLIESSETKQVHHDLDHHVEMVSVVLKSSLEFTTTVKKEKRSSPRRKDKDQREEMFMQFNEFIEFSDFDFTFVADTEELLYGELTPMGPKLYHPCLFCKMPSLNDGMAMKEHLKSWACAVASTVK